MKPGDNVTLRSFGRFERATILRLRGDSARLRMSDGRERTVRASEVEVTGSTPTPMLPPRTPLAQPPILPPAPRLDVARAALAQAVARPFHPVPKEGAAPRSTAYLDWVREKPCAWCSSPPRSEAHHYGKRGKGTKTSDYLTVPLCRICHQRFHDSGALPDSTPAATREAFLQEQIRLLHLWIVSEPK